MDSGGGERKEKRGGDRRTSFRGGRREYEEVGVGLGRGYQQLQRASEGGRSPKSSRADYAGMTSHFSLREYIEREGQIDVPTNLLDGLPPYY